MSLALFVCLALAHPVLPLQPSDAPEPLVQTAMSACLRKGTLGLSREMSNAPLANVLLYLTKPTTVSALVRKFAHKGTEMICWAINAKLR